jgi:hypothetical protein
MTVCKPAIEIPWGAWHGYANTTTYVEGFWSMEMVFFFFFLVFGSVIVSVFFLFVF